MKKILTLLLAVSIFGAVNAQSSKEEARRIILGKEKNKNGNTSQRGRDIVLGKDSRNDDRRVYPNSYPSSRQSQASQINREYDAKIRSIRNNPNLSRAEKDRIIRQLEKDRAAKLRKVRDHDNNRYHKKKKHSDNGKHKGWYKGKGNKNKH
jgi:hypothetical protein